MLRLLIAFVWLFGSSCWAQDAPSEGPPSAPPPPPPADPTWASTEGPAWIPYACPDGTVVFSAHLRGPRSLFYSDETGEVETVRDTTGGDSRWVGGGVTKRFEPEGPMRTTVGEREIGGGACVQDRHATTRDAISNLDGLWIADTRLNPKPGRTGLYLPGQPADSDFRSALFVGTDRFQVTSVHVEQVRVFEANQANRFDLALGLNPALYQKVLALRDRHAAQPLALLLDGELLGRVQVVEPLARDRVVAVVAVDRERLRRIQEALVD